MRRFLALLLVFPIVGPSAQAAPLTFECSGILTSTTVTKDGVADDPIKDIVDISVIVDFDKRAVSGFWLGLNGRHELIPLTAADANAVTFNGVRKNERFEQRIRGSVDPIIGKIAAREELLWARSGNLTHATWDLRCTPART